MALHGLTRVIGITLLLFFIVIVTILNNPNFADPQNLTDLLRWTALFGILALGVAFVIITGGIDLSIGSVVALTGIIAMQLMQVTYYDSGHEVRILSVDEQADSVTIDGPVPKFRNLDEIAVPNPDRRQKGDIRLVIDGEATAKLGQDNTLVMHNSVKDTITGSEGKLLYQDYMNPFVAIGIVLLIGCGIGLVHGLLIGYANLQPFIVTLCGLMAYRGLASWVSNDRPLGLGRHHEEARYLANGAPADLPVPFIEQISAAEGVDAPFWSAVPLPMPMLIFLVLAVLSAVLLHKTVAGRYLLAMGRNAEAAHFSGINTKRMTLLAYVICSGLAALGGVLFALDLNSVQPSSSGNFYELYAIAAAVLGGCSLRGGVGSITGVVIGTAVIRTLYNAINLLDYPTYWQYVIIGVVLLLGVMIDELGRAFVNRFKTMKRRKKLAG